MTEKKGLVSIVVPVFNSEGTIGRCVDSLLNQSYDNIEIIVVNDGSTDNTLKILQGYNNNKLKVLTQENRGVSSARNNALKHAQGEYFAFCDADDFYEKDYLQTMIGMFGKGTCMTCCSYTGKLTSQEVNPQQTTFTIEKAMEELFFDRYLSGFMWNKMLKREYMQGLSFDEQSSFAEDLCYLWQYLKNCRSLMGGEGSCQYTNQKLYHYIITKGSLSSLQLGKRFKSNKLNFLTRLEEINAEAKLLYDGLAEIVYAEQFLIMLQFLLETRFGRENRELHKQLKRRAKTRYCYYKKYRKRYKAFIRRHGGIYRIL